MKTFCVCARHNICLGTDCPFCAYESQLSQSQAELEKADAEILRLRVDRDKWRGVAEKVVSVVNEQAEDEGLWFIAKTAPEGYLQQELRKIHAVIEFLYDQAIQPPVKEEKKP